MALALGIVLLILVAAAVPRLVRAEGRGRAFAYQLGVGPLREPQTDSDGVHRVNLGNDHFVAGVISARLTELDIHHSVYSSGGGEVGVHAVQMLLYDAADEPVVREVLADVADA